MPERGAAALAAMTVLLSNLVSNVPAVLLLRPAVGALPNPQAGWLTLAAASTLADNLTLLGSVANLIVAESAAKRGIQLTFWEYTRSGLVITLLRSRWGWPDSGVHLEVNASGHLALQFFQQARQVQLLQNGSRLKEHRPRGFQVAPPVFALRPIPQDDGLLAQRPAFLVDGKRPLEALRRIQPFLPKRDGRQHLRCRQPQHPPHLPAKGALLLLGLAQRAQSGFQRLFEIALAEIRFGQEAQRFDFGEHLLAAGVHGRFQRMDGRIERAHRHIRPADVVRQTTTCPKSRT